MRRDVLCLVALAALMAGSSCPPAPTEKECSVAADCDAGEVCTEGECRVDENTGEGEGEGEGNTGLVTPERIEQYCVHFSECQMPAGDPTQCIEDATEQLASAAEDPTCRAYVAAVGAFFDCALAQTCETTRLGNGCNVEVSQMSQTIVSCVALFGGEGEGEFGEGEGEGE